MRVWGWGYLLSAAFNSCTSWATEAACRPHAGSPMQAHSSMRCRAVRASPWMGGWATGVWGRGYLLGLEDPFDGGDNVFRTLSLTNAKLIRDAMEKSANSLASLDSEAGAPVPVWTSEDVQTVRCWSWAVGRGTAGLALLLTDAEAICCAM